MTSVYITLLASIWVFAILNNHLSSAWRLDCSKFVFAPKCRGVAAKRGLNTGVLENKGYFSEPNFNNVADRFEAARDSNGLGEGQGQMENGGYGPKAWMARQDRAEEDSWSSDPAVAEMGRVLKNKKVLAFLMRLAKATDTANGSVKNDSTETTYQV